MADNVAITQGTGTDVATDDIGGVHHQVIKVGIGAANAIDGHLDFGQAAMAASLPVALSSDHSDVKVTLDGETVELGATALAALETITVAAVTAAIPAGNNNIGDVDVASIAAGNNNIGDVDIASIAAGDNNIGNVDIASALPAGTNAIGKLAANSGVDIGDVDVTSLPKSIQGPGIPNIDSYTSAAISAAANTADQSLVAAPGANKQIWVYGFVGTADTADGSVSLQDEDNTAASGVMVVTLRGGFAISPSGNFSMPWLKIATNKALEIDTVTCGFKGVISYAIVSV
jgi:hypothetical protein